MEICKTYFKINNNIINGFKISKNNNSFKIYVYTTCEKLNNWQLFLHYNSIKEVREYFKKLLDSYVRECNQDIEWNRIETEWVRHTLNILNTIEV